MIRRRRARPGPGLPRMASISYVLRFGFPLTVLSVCSSTPAIAQIHGLEERAPPDGHAFVFSHWTTADGLPQNSINDILETADGRIWLATFGGLARFDGGSFTSLGVSNTPGLESDQILAVTEASAGGVWIVTLARNLLRIDADSIVEKIPLPTPEQPVSGGLWIDPDGVIWVAAMGAVHRYEHETWRSFAWQEGLPGQISAIEFDSDGQLWVATRAGLVRFEQDRFHLVEVDPSLRGVSVLRLKADGSGRLWLGTTAGLAVLDRGDQIVRPVSIAGATLQVGAITGLGVGKDDELWLGGSWGLSHLHLDHEEPEARVLYEHRSIDGRTVDVIERDRRGNTWAGTKGGGLARFAPSRLWHLTQADGLPSREVNQIVGNGEGGVWIAGGCHGLAYVGIDTVMTVSIGGGGLPGECVSALWRDRSGSVWVGQDGYLSRLDGLDISRTWGPESGLPPGGRVAPIVEDSLGRIWFGFGSGGLGFVQDSTVRLYEAPIGLPEVQVNSMAFDSTGALWVGQIGTVSRVSVDGSEIRDVTVLGRADSVPPGAIRVIHRDRDGHLWVGSYGGGLARCVEGGESFHRPLTTDQGLPDNAISAMVEDEKGRLWILGNRGVSVVNGAVVDSVAEGTRKYVDAVLFDHTDGMPEGNGGNPAAWLDAEGVAWFATIDGIVAMDTREFPRDTVIPVPRIGSIQFSDEDWTGTGPIVVAGGAREVSFRYSSSSTATRGGTLYRYRLRGQDEHWIYSDVSGLARYPRVPPGRYAFSLEARNEDGLWSREPAVVEFQLLPLWWDTTWFRWGAGLLAAVLIGAGLIRRVRRAESRNRQLLLAIQERDLAEERIHRQQRELEHVSRVATAGELATSLAHELNQPLMAIVSNAAAGDMLLSNPDMGKDVVREALEDIAADGKRASEVIKGLREFLKRGSVEFEQLYVNQVVRDVLVLLGSELRESGVDVRLDLDGDLPMVEGNQVQLQQVLVNLVMNALEAMCGQNTECRLGVKTRSVDQGVSISVHDTGPGLPAGEEDQVFDAFVTTKESGMGVGLAISRTMVTAHGGNICAGSNEGGGAEFVVTLPSVESTPVSAEPDTAVAG